MTDQGYLREGGVVWERMSGIDGDTQFYQVGGAVQMFWRITG